SWLSQSKRFVEEPTAVGSQVSTNYANSGEQLQEIHESFGHVAISRLKQFIPTSISQSDKDNFECRACVLSKQPSNHSRASQQLPLDHSKRFILT
ncbi:hypothetical protein VP01_10221g1, partial [Puccinia sorghi]